MEFFEEIWEFQGILASPERFHWEKTQNLGFLEIPEGENSWNFIPGGLKFPNFLVFFQEGEDEEGRDSEKGELGIPKGEIPGIFQGLRKGKSWEIQGKIWKIQEFGDQGRKIQGI